MNWHLEPRCNYACGFCYATFTEIVQLPRLPKAEGASVLRAVAESGVDKINFVGGEPMLHPHLGEYIREAKRLGMTTSIVSNGTGMTRDWLKQMRPHLDWLGLSIDASTDELHAQMGRGLKGEIARKESNHLQRTLEVLESAIVLDYGIKLNTVVNRFNLQDDMSWLISLIEPDRWKVFQVLPIEGENDATFASFRISDDEFAEYVGRHRQKLARFGIEVVAEQNDDMLGTYSMIDPSGYVYTNADGFYLYSRESVQEIGFREAWSQVAGGFDSKAFQARGGTWDWNRTVGVDA